MSSLLERLRQALAPHYQVERELASGGMGTVFLARDPNLDRPVAIKILRPDIASDIASERFLREARILARLSHPNVVPVFQAGEADGLSYYVMEYVEGATLKERLERGRMPKEEALRLANDLLSALEEAHKHGIVHRDVKPGNIFLVGDRALLGDFGIAKQTGESATGLTAPGRRIGTPDYMPPEQIAGDATPRTDLYAVGMVLYKALTGRRWSIADTITEVDWSGVPSELVAPLQRALAFAPEERWQDAASFRNALARSQHSAAKRRVVVAAAASAAALVLAAGWLWLESRSQGDGEEPNVITPSPGIAVLPFRVVGPETELWREGMVDLISTNLDGVVGLRSIDPRAVLSRWRSEFGEASEPGDLQAALEVAQALGATYALMGSAVALGDDVRLSVEVYDARTGAVQGSAQVDGSPDSLINLIDGLSLEILRAGLVGDPEDLPQLDLGQITTTSVPALKAYLAGEQKFRRSHFEESIPDFTRAVELDSTFALALHRLADAYGWTQGISQRSDEIDERAGRFVDRLPRRAALLFGAAAADWAQRRAAIQGLEEFTARFPEDVEGWYSLGDAYFHLGDEELLPPDKFRAAFQRALDLDPSFSPAYIHLIDAAFARGDSAEAGQLVAAFERVGPASPDFIGAGLAYALVWGDSTSKTEARLAMDTANGSALRRALLYLYRSTQFPHQMMQVSRALAAERYTLAHRQGGQRGIVNALVTWGRLREARDALSSMPGEEPFGLMASRAYLGWHLVGYRDLSTARRATDVLAADPTPEDRFLLGAFAATENERDVVEAQIEALEASATSEAGDAQKREADYSAEYAQALRGYAALRRGEHETAEQLLRESLVVLPGTSAVAVRDRIHRLLRYELGKLLVEGGKLGDAERFLKSLEIHDQWLSPIYAPPIELYLGRTYESIGSIEDAKRYYTRLVRRWEECDAGLRPLLEEARQALSRLAREPVRN